MINPHTIRLRGPWLYEVIERFDGEGDSLGTATSGRIKLPCDWGKPPWGDFFGRARFTRTFNWPEPLEPNERLALVFEVGNACVSAELNGQTLLQFGDINKPVRVDVTDRIKINNRLAIDVRRVNPKARDDPSSSPAFIREVYLEVTRDE